MPATEYRVIAGPDTVINQKLPALFTTGWKPILMSSTTLNGQHVITVMLEHQPQAAQAPAGPAVAVSG